MPRRGSRILLVLLPLCFLVAASPGPRSALAASPAASGSIHRFEPEFMASNHHYSRAQAVAQAREFDVIAALRGSFTKYIGSMKAANPKLKLLVYMNGGYSANDNGSRYRGSWYAHGTTANRIKSRAFGSYLMNIGTTGWRQHVADRCVRLRRTSGYDGCFLDSLGPAALEPAYVSALPVNPRNGRIWTRSAYLRATASLAHLVKSKLGTRSLVVNGVQNGMAYFDPGGSTGILADGIDGGMVELFTRPPFVPIGQHRPMASWLQDVTMLVDAGARGRSLLCVSKAWGPGTAAQKAQAHLFALGTFLLGTNGRSYFSFLDSYVTDKADGTWTRSLGAATGRYSTRSGAYQRAFSKGLVLVNPSGLSRTVKLPRTYMKGTQKVNSVSLVGYSAVILTLP